MSSQASPQARRDRVSNPSATAPELVVDQGLYDTLIQRLTEDLQCAVFLVSVGVTPKKARARKALQLRKTDTPKSVQSRVTVDTTESRGRSTTLS